MSEKSKAEIRMSDDVGEKETAIEEDRERISKTKQN